MSDCMTFPETVDEFMESYKMVDTEHIYSNGAEYVPIFRMKQWFEHQPECKTGRWEKVRSANYGTDFRCSACHRYRFHNGEMRNKYIYCPNCGAKMEVEQNE